MDNIKPVIVPPDRTPDIIKQPVPIMAPTEPPPVMEQQYHKPVIVPVDPPPELRTLISLLSDYNLTMDDVDLRMMEVLPEWKIGDARKKVKKYPLLAKTVAEARALVLREAGADKVESVKRYVEAQGAKKVVCVGDKEYDEVVDHEVRIKGADRVLTMMGESPIAVPKTEVLVDNRSVNVDSETLREFVRAVSRLESVEVMRCDQTGER